MRRRAKPDVPADVPVKLTRFDAAEWGGDRWAPNRWYAARDAWCLEHPDRELPGPDLASWPDAAFDPESV